MVRVMLIDADNMLISRADVVTARDRVTALLAAAVQVDHVIVTWPVDSAGPDPVAELDLVDSTTKEHRFDVLRIDPDLTSPDALIEHARRVARAVKSLEFVVASMDGNLAELAKVGSVDVLLWDGQPLAARLAAAARRVVRVSPPDGHILGTTPAATSQIVDVSRARHDGLPSADGIYREQPFGRAEVNLGSADILQFIGFSGRVVERSDSDRVVGILAAAAAGAALGATRPLAEALIDVFQRNRP